MCFNTLLIYSNACHNIEMGGWFRILWKPVFISWTWNCTSYNGEYLNILTTFIRLRQENPFRMCQYCVYRRGLLAMKIQSNMSQLKTKTPCVWVMSHYFHIANAVTFASCLFESLCFLKCFIINQLDKNRIKAAWRTQAEFKLIT